ncbi:MAG TPA: GNAT family N-acetyltransferase [Rhodospirillales bacterium]|jgi:GNAT superfamily N-acetyltransferase|nr:GNAT family N-acetyltransferase [Rhodospirillales bacterium]
MDPRSDSNLVIREAEGAADMETVRELFLEYQAAIGVDLCFQDFDEELKNLPGRYQRPFGCLLLATDADQIAAVIGMGPLGEGVAEMKRLYVRAPWRGTELGRRLADAVVRAARDAGHQRICLDTLEFMTEARALYQSMGFNEIPAYYDNPLDGVIYMECAL